MTLRNRQPLESVASSNSEPKSSLSSSLLPESTKTVEPLDEIEQERAIVELRAQAAHYESQILYAFQGLCIAVATTMALFTYWTDIPDDKDTWWAVLHYGHLVLAVTLLEHSCRFLSNSSIDDVASRNLEQLCTMIALNIVEAAFAIYYATQKYHAAAMDNSLLQDWNQTLYLHYGLTIGNALIVGAAMLMKYDQQQTQQALQALQKARYDHKSL